MSESDGERVRRVEELIAERGLEADIVWHRGRAVLSLEDAMNVLSINPGNVLKCIILKGRRGKTVGVIARGDVRIDMKKLEEVAGVRKPRFMNEEELRERLGVEPGGIDPLTLPQRVDVVLVERSLLEKDFVIGSAGSRYCGLRICPREILRVVEARVVDLAEGR